MSDFNTVSPANDVLSQYSFKTDGNKASGDDLGKNEFMELMIAQLNNQNPLEPQGNGEFIADLAQFSSLEEMQGLTATVEGFTSNYQSTQALQASSMVGRSVLVNASSGPTSMGGTIGGVVDVPASTSDLRISVLNQSGELVNQYEMGQQFAGQVPFLWDGKNTVGDQMPAGQYSIKAEASYSGKTEQLGTMLSANVDSVSVGKGGITLNLAGMGGVPLSEIRQIN
ncbi:flagellar hook assembly protein FlgD [Alkalimarinus alittae]|uniref:Basal-body rod modification protein FlgD n=1 Tax=Alkalimarinus alittae TaxID=2961619 RepID=A0ABY6N6E1_9ALTE|nr:flagellar hook assembly protein FlgD [Alkalimarinus alittae]UZE97683.1 flagellar hook assembly protein FlgD [Alkalimarinus alittae]